jgi:regulator of cell morphogenesis and NO signaling
VTKVDSIDLEQRLGALVAERPAVTVALECLGLDYCCGGGQTLSEASRRRGLDPATVAVVLERFADTAAGRRAGGPSRTTSAGRRFPDSATTS